MKNILKSFFFFLTIASIASCVKGDFDEPEPGGVDPTDIPDESIVSLDVVLDLWIGGQFTKIDMDKYVKGVIAADDKSGNFYKNLIFQDETGDKAIALLIDNTDLYTQYPVGRRVFIHLKDLWISDYNGLPQLGYGSYVSGTSLRMAGIPSVLMTKIVRQGKFGIPVVPTTVKINQLGEALLNKLVKFENVQFKSASAGKPYADADLELSVKHTLAACDGGEVIVRTSGFSTFARDLTPEGSGSLVGIYSVFGSDKQIILRDPSDIVMTAERCGGGGGNVSTIKGLRDAFNAGATSAGAGTVKGVVVSDKNSGNLNSKNLYLQDATAGILVRFTGNNTFSIGDEIEVDVTGVELSEFNGLLQLNNMPNGNAAKTGTQPLPLKVLTIKELTDNFETYESTRVQIKDATISGGATYSGNRTVTDATGTIAMFTLATASFASQSIPTGTVSIIALASQFNSPQIILNNAADVSGGGGGGGDDVKWTIKQIKDTYTGVTTTAPNGYIEGVVISDFNTGHVSPKNVVIQDGDYGIVVRFVADPNVAVGKTIKVKISGVELSAFNELLQLNNVPNANLLATTNGSTVTPKLVTIADINANFENYESTLVKINNATITGGTTFSGTLKVTDATGILDLFTRTAATFAANSVPGGTVSVTGIISQFKSATTTGNGYQISIRDPNDIK